MLSFSILKVHFPVYSINQIPYFYNRRYGGSKRKKVKKWQKILSKWVSGDLEEPDTACIATKSTFIKANWKSWQAAISFPSARKI